MITSHQNITLNRPTLLWLQVGISIAVTMGFGYQLDQHLLHDPVAQPMVTVGAPPLFLTMLLIAGTGWCLQLAFSRWVLGKSYLAYWKLLGQIMTIGVLILVPGFVLDALTGFQYWWILASATLISSLTMLRIHAVKAEKQGFPTQLTIWWFAFLQGTAIGWIAVFYG